MTYTSEETARYLHHLDERVKALEGNRDAAPIDAVTIDQAAVFFKVSRRTVYNWIKARKVRFGYMPSGKIRVYTDALSLKEGSISVD